MQRKAYIDDDVNIKDWTWLSIYDLDSTQNGTKRCRVGVKCPFVHLNGYLGTNDEINESPKHSVMKFY